MHQPLIGTAIAVPAAEDEKIELKGDICVGRQIVEGQADGLIVKLAQEGGAAGSSGGALVAPFRTRGVIEQIFDYLTDLRLYGDKILVAAVLHGDGMTADR